MELQKCSSYIFWQQTPWNSANGELELWTNSFWPWTIYWLEVANGQITRLWDDISVSAVFLRRGVLIRIKLIYRSGFFFFIELSDPLRSLICLHHSFAHPDCFQGWVKQGILPAWVLLPSLVVFFSFDSQIQDLAYWIWILKLSFWNWTSMYHLGAECLLRGTLFTAHAALIWSVLEVSPTHGLLPHWLWWMWNLCESAV